jgi:hypothetical protein
VHDGRALALAKRLGDIDHVRVAIVHELDRGERVIPSEIDPTNARHFFRESSRRDRNRVVRQGENAPRTKRRNSFRARFAFHAPGSLR